MALFTCIYSVNQYMCCLNLFMHSSTEYIHIYSVKASHLLSQQMRMLLQSQRPYRCNSCDKVRECRWMPHIWCMIEVLCNILHGFEVSCFKVYCVVVIINRGVSTTSAIVCMNVLQHIIDSHAYIFIWARWCSGCVAYLSIVRSRVQAS